MLDVKNIVTTYGKIEALKGVTLAAEEGRITCLLGPNGAGKTTLMYSIAGILQATVRHDPVCAATRSPAVAGRPSLAAGWRWSRKTASSFRRCRCREPRSSAPTSAATRLRSPPTSSACTALSPPQRTLHPARGTLSGGEQQMLSVARALMSRPQAYC